MPLVIPSIEPLCAQVRKYRALHKMKLAEFGEKVGLSREDVWEIEKGRVVNPPAEVHSKIKSLLQG